MMAKKSRLGKGGSSPLHNPTTAPSPPSTPSAPTAISSAAEESLRLLGPNESQAPASPPATGIPSPAASDDEDGAWDPDTPLPRWHSSTLKKRRRFTWCSMFLLLFLAAVVAGTLYIWRREAYLQSPWLPDDATNDFAQAPLPPPSERHSILQRKLPLRTRGRHIVDAAGDRFKLHSVNWYGASDELFVPGGLEVRHRTAIAQTIRRLGFNSVRLPYADELVLTNPVIAPHLVLANPDLAGLRALDVLEAVVAALTDAGLAVIVNNHITTATWCCGANPCDAGWANDHLGGLCAVRQTEEGWIRNWETVMARLRHDPLVIAVDLRNEVRGLWGTMPWATWAAAAERCGDRLLTMNPDWLVVVEGTESANDVSGARRRPVVLRRAPDKLVYSAHVYAWSGWGSWGGRFAQRGYASFVGTMRHNWLWLLEQDVAPVWVGELGAARHTSRGGARYWRNLWRLLKDVDADFGYWAVNPTKAYQSTVETYALLEADWETPVLDYRMKDMVELMQR